MADIQLRDEAVRDRIRAAEEFLDPSKMICLSMDYIFVVNVTQMMRGLEG